MAAHELRTGSQKTICNDRDNMEDRLTGFEGESCIVAKSRTCPEAISGQSTRGIRLNTVPPANVSR